MGRPGSAGAAFAVWAAAGLKAVAAVLPMLAVGGILAPAPPVPRRQRLLRVLAWIEAAILTSYGLVLTVAGLLVQGRRMPTTGPLSGMPTCGIPGSCCGACWSPPPCFGPGHRVASGPDGSPARHQADRTCSGPARIARGVGASPIGAMRSGGSADRSGCQRRAAGTPSSAWRRWAQWGHLPARRGAPDGYGSTSPRRRARMPSANRRLMQAARRHQHPSDANGLRGPQYEARVPILERAAPVLSGLWPGLVLGSMLSTRQRSSW